MYAFEDFSSNIEVIIQKCSYLDFADQIKLASACVQLTYVLKNYIWKEKYQTLNILEKSQEYVVKNETNENGICLNAYDIQEFQKHYADKVHKLCISNIVLHMENYEDLVGVLYGRMLRKNILNIKQFQNLKSLSYSYMGVPKDHLKQITEINPNLEELNLVNCFVDISIDELLRDVVLQMKNLKSLSIENFQRFKVKSSRFQELLTMANLERLQLTAVIEPDEHIARSSDQTPANLKDLTIQITIQPLKWPNNLPAYFRSLETLTTLTIGSVENLTDTALAVIAEICPNLERLNIRCTNFENIEVFPIAAKVTSLFLISCRGLSCDNLRHLLTQKKITIFHSIATIYDGVFEGSRVSPCIRSLRLDGINSQKLTFAYRANRVQALRWLYPVSPDQQDATSKSFAWCKGLRALDMHNGYLPLEMLMTMKTLHCLAIPQPITTTNWSYVTDLLKHPSLRELSLRNTPNVCKKIKADVPTEGFSTNVTSLHMPLAAFNVALDFWLDLLTKNEHLRQIWCSYHPHDKYDIFLAKLIYHPNFPKSADNIDINGFKISCIELKWNFAATMDRLKSQIEVERCWFEDDLYRIGLLT